MADEAPRWFHRSCPICEAACGLRVHADLASRKVLRIEGDPDDPRSRGFLCPKSQAMKGVFEDPDRIKRPLRRTADGWQEIGWEEALEFAAAGLLRVQAEHGNDAVGGYIGNPTGFDVGAMMYNRLLSSSLRSTRLFSAVTMDHFPKLVVSRVLYGKGAILPVPDIDRTEYFLCLGGNPIVSQGSLMSAPDIGKRMRDVQERGGKIVVVDPRRTETARVADEHLFIRPGSDPLFLFAMVNVFFEEGLVALGRLGAAVDGIDEVRELAAEFTPEAVATATGIEAFVTRRIAREFAAAESACCYGRIGTCTVEFGTLASWLLDVVGILTGNYDEPGGMMFPRPATGQVEAGREAEPLSVGRWRTAARGLPEVDGTLPCSALAEEIDSAGEARMRGFVTVAGNPVLSTPNGARLDRALPDLDFMVAIDIYLNETTRHADVILPTLVQLEHENFDYLTSSTAVRNFVRWSPRVFQPEPDGRAHWEVLLELSARMLGTSAEALEEQTLHGKVRRAVGRRGRPAENISFEAALAKLGTVPGPMRSVDLMLRTGPFGDGFDDDAEGLSLAKLRAVPHSVDLGPLEPRLLEVIRTPGKRIPLAHEYITSDVPRLRGMLAEGRGSDSLLLIGRRQARNMNSWLHNVEVLARGKQRCTLLVNGKDAARLGITDGAQAHVKSRVGEVTAQVEVSDDMMPGVVSLPHGFGHTATETRLGTAAKRQPGVNANVLTDEEPLDIPSGTSIANGIPVEVWLAAE